MISIKKHILLLLVVLFSTDVSAASQSSYLEIILDASGSMWEKVQGEHKIKIAKNTLQKLIPTLDPNHHVGLLVYGHRKSQDCQDIELVVPPGIANRQSILKRIEIIEPKERSMTPIASALEEAAKNLKQYEGEKGILLISDGKESCGKDPCKVMQDLIQKGFQVKVNIVGFDIKEKEADAELSCIAKATGGTYVSAKNADDLFKEIEKSTKALVSWNLEVKGPNPLSLRYTVIDEKTGETVKKDEHLFSKALLPAGMYTVKVNTAPPFVKKNVEIKENEQTIVEVKGSGTLYIEVPRAATYYVSVLNESDQYILEKEYLFKSGGFILLSGQYKVQISRDKNSPPFWTKKDVIVSPNQKTSLTLSGIGTLWVHFLQSATYYLNIKNKDDQYVFEKAYVFKENSFDLEAGEYTLELSRSSKSSPFWTKKGVLIKDGQKTNIEEEGLGLMKVQLFPSVTYYVNVKDSKDVYLFTKEYGWSSVFLDVPIGTYTVEVLEHQNDSKPLYVQKDIQIKNLEATGVPLPQGLTRLDISGGGTSYLVTIVNDKDQVVIDKQKVYSNEKFHLPPGTYTVDALNSDTLKSILVQGKASITLKPLELFRFEIKKQ